MRVFILSLLVLISISTYSQDQKIELGDLSVKGTPSNYGIEGSQAPELQVPLWVDEDGKKTEPILLKDLEGKFTVIYCFQAWCPGCHSRGLPALQEMTKALAGNDDIQFLAIQTVFEGSHANTFGRMLEIQKEYLLKIPFGHDIGDNTTWNRSSVLTHYRTGGTPWFIFIDQSGKVVYNNFHIDTEKAIEYLKSL